MAEVIINRSGTAEEHASFIGELAEITVDTTKKTIVVHDGVTPGGKPMLSVEQFDEFKNESIADTDYVAVFTYHLLN